MSEDTAIALMPEPANVELGTLKADTPAALISGATAMADTLADVIRSRNLSVRIGQGEHVRVEGWLTLGTMMGVLPREESVERLEDGGYIATVSLVRMTDGTVLTRASAECGMDERDWAKRPAFARRSMAITRATAKACRIAFSWVMTLSGYSGTPAEEMPYEQDEAPPADRPRSAPRSASTWSPSEAQVKRAKAIAFKRAEELGVEAADVFRAINRVVLDLGYSRIDQLDQKVVYDRLCDDIIPSITPEGPAPDPHPEAEEVAPADPATDDVPF